MTEGMFVNAMINLWVGVTLLFAWRNDKKQPFVFWIGLSFLISSFWLPGFWLYFHGDGPWKWLGVLIWATQAVLSIVLLAVGVAQLHDRPLPPRWVAAGSIVLILLYAVVAFIRPESAATLLAITFLFISLPVARKLVIGPGPEKIAGVLLLLNALVWFMLPIWGFAVFSYQSVAVAVVRLGLGLALIYACLRRSAIAAERMSRQFERLTEGSHQGIVVIQNGQVAYMNPELMRMFHLESIDQIPADWGQWGMSDDDRLKNEGRRRQLASGEAPSLSWVQSWRLRDGTPLRLRLSAWRVDWHGRPAEQIVISDETELHNTAQQLMHQASHDALTGLPNRIFVREQFILRHQLRGASAAPVSVMLIDLDNFSAINNSLGYVAGDEFLRLVAARIESVLYPDDLLARISGDEFLIMSVAAQAREEVIELAERVLEVLRQPFHLNALNLTTSGSIGIADYPGDGDTFEQLLIHATIASRQAKDAGRNTFLHFDESMNSNRLEEMQLMAELHDALRLGQLRLHFQPIMDARGERAVGLEALIRWVHPDRGMISPARFIPIAERAGLIIDIGEWVIDQACRTLKTWSSEPAFSELTVSVNISATQFSRGNIDQVLRSAFARHDPPQHLLELEITESALINDPEQFVSMLAKIRDLGVRLAIDDFGTGYSNLSYLQRFQVDKLKVDQSFVQRLCTSPQDRAIVKAVIQMAQSLGMKTTAEGVETEEMHKALQELGCDQMQGYLFSRPLPEDECRQFVAECIR